MFTSHGSNDEQIAATRKFLQSNAGNAALTEELQELAKLTAKEIVKLVVPQDRKEFVRDVFNEYDQGYGEAVRIAFENQVVKEASYIRVTDRTTTASMKAIAEAYCPEKNTTKTRTLITESSTERRKPRSIPSAQDKITESIYDVLPLIESINDAEYNQLIETLSEDQTFALNQVLNDDIDATMVEIAEDLQNLSDEEMDAIISESSVEDCEAFMDAFDDLCEDEELQEMISEGILDTARQSAANAYAGKKSSLEKASKTKGVGFRRKLNKYALKATAKVNQARHAAGKPGRAIRSAAAGAKAYGSAVKTGIKNAVTNAARSSKDAVRNKYTQAKNATTSTATNIKNRISSAGKAVWRGVKRVGARIKGAAKLAIGRGVNFLRKQGDFANKVDSRKKTFKNSAISRASRSGTTKVRVPNVNRNKKAR